MVRDYETPTVPPAWARFAQEWSNSAGLGDRPVQLVCSPDRYGNAVVVRLALPDGNEAVATRRSSDADDAAERREKFLQAVETGQFTAVELDVAGYYVSEGSVPCSFCVEGPPHEEWQHVLLRELLRIGAPAAVPAGLSPEDADDAEQAALDRQVAALLRSR